MAHMDPASIRAAAYRERIAAAAARYDEQTRKALSEYGCATFTVANYRDLEIARDAMIIRHPNAVQCIYIDKTRLSDFQGRKLAQHARDMGVQHGYYVKFTNVNPCP